MANPDAPGNIAVKPGPHPNSIYVNADAVTASPTVDYYTVYIDSLTGVAITQFKATKDSTLPDILVQGLPEYPEYFVNMTATNSDNESIDGTETSIVVRK